MKALVAHAARDIRIETREVREAGPSEVTVQIERGGICGSDLHYYHHGGFGTVKLREPMILGHEIAGTIINTGDEVTHLRAGQRVAVSPSRPCRRCDYCLSGTPNHCLNMRFYGSAMPYPHIQGAFREQLTVQANQCAVTDDLTMGEAAMAEPLAVAIHALAQAGTVTGKSVLVTGCGPIGLLCILAARSAGAVNITATDIADYPLRVAGNIGADSIINATDQASLEPWYRDKGCFDVLFECTGVTSALAGAIPAIKPGGVIVQLGLGGDMNLPVQQITAKELQLRGSFRFHNEFFTGVKWMRSGQIDVKPLITHTLPLTKATEAFELASDRTQALKVQLAMNGSD
jgi:L-idonate 5-dehydrogenase